MQLSVLLPVLALLASPLVDARDAHTAGSRRSLNRHAKHVRAADEVAQNVARREQLAQENPRALRKVKRGANGCRAKGSTYTAPATTNSTTSAIAAASSTSTSAAVAASSADAGQNYVQPSASAESSAAPAQSSAASSGGGTSVQPAGGVTPNGIKAGLSGTDTIDAFAGHVSWYWNYGPTKDSSSDLTFVPTLWGNGHTGDQDSSRLSAFESMDWSPQYVQGFYEPDCTPPMSSAISPADAAPLWNSAIAPWKAKGALLVSPGLCKQADDDWLTPFQNAIGSSNMWDITSVHINKLDMTGAKLVLDHYWNTYGKPMWVTEFACVDDQNGFTPVEDQGQINTYINSIVDLLEGDSRVAAYSMSEGEGLAYNWAPYRDGQLTESGRTYLNAISKYH